MWWSPAGTDLGAIASRSVAIFFKVVKKGVIFCRGCVREVVEQICGFNAASISYAGQRVLVALLCEGGGAAVLGAGHMGH